MACKEKLLEISEDESGTLESWYKMGKTRDNS